MHATSRYNREATYKFALLVVRNLPKVLSENPTKKLFASLKKHWEPLPFIVDEPACQTSTQLMNDDIGIILAFWLSKHYVLEDDRQSRSKQRKPLQF